MRWGKIKATTSACEKSVLAWLLLLTFAYLSTLFEPDKKILSCIMHQISTTSFQGISYLCMSSNSDTWAFLTCVVTCEWKAEVTHEHSLLMLLHVSGRQKWHMSIPYLSSSRFRCSGIRSQYLVKKDTSVVNFLLCTIHGQSIQGIGANQG